MTAHKRGFTLIELLIVIAVLGILATVVLVAVNPVEQLARARDSGRKSTLAQLGHAMEAYGTSHDSVYILETGWTTDNASNALVTSGEISSVPALVAAKTGHTLCAPGANGVVVNGWCYNTTTAGTGAGPAIIYTKLESKTEISKCPVATPANIPWYTWSSQDGRSGLVCSVAEPIPGAQTWNTVQ